MPRLFVFAIGGTGSRVLKSLSMLLASGVKPNNSKEIFEIVPIIIDPHSSNEDLKRTSRILNLYQSITDAVGTKSGFFSTSIKTLNNITDSENTKSDNFTFNLQSVSNTKFRDYIDYNNLPESSKSLADILFSGNSIDKRGSKINLLDIEMDIGFVGNPNIGSVVLNQFKDSDEFKGFSNIFGEGDRIFIISSIFGGTGAAGFPTILKNIRNALNNSNLDSRGFLQNAPIGALTVLPYFNIETKEDSPIQKSDFISKTRSALYYYKDNVTGNNSVNAMYYITDSYTSGKPLENDPGGNGQKNDAHYIEMISALSIINFLEIDNSELQNESGKAVRPIYKEFSLRNEKEDLIFQDFADGTEKLISTKLTQFMMLKKYIDEKIENSVEKESWSLDEPKINNQFLNQLFYRTHLNDFLDLFNDWIIEMSKSGRKFSPFNVDSNLNVLVKGMNVKEKYFAKKLDYSFYDNILSKISKNSKYTSSEQKMIKLFYDATKEISINKIGLKN